MGKSLVLSVSVGKGCYRHIQIDESATLFALHGEIMYAFEFDDDHLHAFFMNNRAWDRNMQYICPGGNLDSARGFSDKITLSRFHLGKGDKFLYIFDFGDAWRFQIRVLRVIDGSTKKPAVLKSVGEVRQYGYYEDEDI
ncbi:MAG: plasmid pRiA4b ORF-3 family protein [Dehalococcoidia bacterium]|nr:plasmid pRiA4b ORF-3 family protein [Dehalococcoidia bacterium]MCL2149972.1 plasmid pRiA4b ORF-3 family protein [Dehalococcoidia bacterium]